MYIDPRDLEKVIQAIIGNQCAIQWKPGKAQPHLSYDSESTVAKLFNSSRLS
jgi:hypothetical protein